MNLKLRFRVARGVTLVELMVVISVAAILASVSAPTVFGAIRRERARAIANEVANHLRKARNQAMARGEALRVYVRPDPTGSGGAYIKTYRTSLQLPDGTTQSGGTTCVEATEDISTDDCPAGSVCMDGGCWGRPARSCRELTPGAVPSDDYTTDNVRYIKVDEFSIAAGHDLTIADAYGGGTTVLCFSPDGRAEKEAGGIPAPLNPGTSSCDLENFNIWITDKASAPTASDDLTCDAGP